MTPNPGFSVTVLCRRIFQNSSLSPTAQLFIYLISSVICRWRAVHQRASC